MSVALVRRRVGAEKVRVEADRCNPARNEPSILPGRDGQAPACADVDIVAIVAAVPRVIRTTLGRLLLNSTARSFSVNERLPISPRRASTENIRSAARRADAPHAPAGW